MIRLRGQKGKFAVLSIGRLNFHVDQNGMTIGWRSDKYIMYYPAIDIDWRG